MRYSSQSVRRQVTIVRQYKGIGITAKLQGYHIDSAQAITARFYNGRVAYQHGKLRVGLTSLRRQPSCCLVLTIEEPGLPF